MLSEAVYSSTIEFFSSHDYFGLRRDQVIFFNQDNFPCLSKDGRIILETRGKVSSAPNGNGGLWQALKDQGLLDKMKRSGTKWIASFIVDNILVKIADPLFLGFTIDHNLDIASKVVPKAYPEERVGVLAVRDGKFTVLEYSEINEKERLALSPQGDLKFNASHLVINNFKFEFVEEFCSDLLQTLPLHVAHKVVPCVDEQGNTVKPSCPNAYKLELFAFDIFCWAKSMYAFQTERRAEFSPLKNSTKSSNDNPDTCRRDLSNLHKKWVRDAGGIILNDTSDGLCEISPLVSYDGEGLEFLEGKHVTLPFYLNKF
eukprot:TRINITY_DN4182_c0_g1_i1.p1 TRINITY_DN4182_c0_g1~~TRINITY_DN4182_c0_g1_i1.p1  ORF type:complete len:315 (-),score=50.77 TRINITY_DN4182_c0_g1_i1:185-1129(-)